MRPDWPDSYRAERAWLLFLMELRNEQPDMEKLMDYQNEMNMSDKEKAINILKNLKKE
jgi:hypothetical protein